VGIISKELVRTKIDWPKQSSLIVVEENPSDDENIHIHICHSSQCGWAYRLHFTYDEFEEFARAIIDKGKL
tara:strand:- start:4 stop:216 length:213 start_codon:yes stop_codon:yes gene_type:complete